MTTSKEFAVVFDGTSAYVMPTSEVENVDDIISTLSNIDNAQKYADILNERASA